MKGKNKLREEKSEQYVAINEYMLTQQAIISSLKVFHCALSTNELLHYIFLKVDIKFRENYDPHLGARITSFFSFLI